MQKREVSTNVSYHGKERNGVSRREERPGSKRILKGGRWRTRHVCHGRTTFRVVDHRRRHDLTGLLFSVQQSGQRQETSEPAKRRKEEEFEHVFDGRWRNGIILISKRKGSVT